MSSIVDITKKSINSSGSLNMNLLSWGGSIEEVVRPQYGGTWGRWRRRGRGQNRDDPDIVFKLSSRLYSFGKFGSTRIFPLFHFYFHFFFCDFFPVNDNSLSFTDGLPPDEEAFALKACGNIHIKFNRDFSNCPNQQKTRPIDK